MEDKVRLRVLGLTYSQSQTGNYALVLAEEGSDRRIPIMIGAFEAQSIALHLEELNPPRPLTHDLFLSFSKAFDITLKEVVISRLHEGIFYSVLYFFDGNDIIMIDSRTSDAVALALRFKCPIYTTKEIVENAGIVLEGEEEKSLSNQKSDPPDQTIGRSEPYEEMDIDELQELLRQSIDNEDYEKASEIQNVIKKRKKT